MKPNAQETRETFRDYVINTRPLYEGITAPALTLAANLRAAIATVNRQHAPEIGGAALIETDADKRAAISVYLNEIQEVLEWELIGAEQAARRERYRVEETGGVVTVWENPKRYGFRFKKGDTLAQYTVTVIIPPGKASTVEGQTEIQAATEEFLQYAAERFPAEFGTELH